ncbi:proton-activated chloride channel [Brienomyrus brachyistius]|uniref:proton-activated chloride channel n=1 Tax=Brienomyrus brachyistius TaxID=42636 RepID=UPI0020B39802|nr:proton-activated chloride channel [Brienomyrus brachyistius]
MTRENCRTYQKFSDDARQCPSVCQENGKSDQILDDGDDSDLPGVEDDTGSISIGFNRACLKNVFTVLLILIYVLLTAVALFLAYQTISDFREKLSHPVMSVTFKEVDEYDAVGIALYLGKATLLSCQHHLHDHIPALVSPGNPGDGGCVMESVSYMDPYSNQTREVTVVQGPTDIRNRELIFLQFSQNETEEDFSSITYMLFYKFADLTASSDKAEFMKECVRNYSMWTFSGGFRTWVKMSLIRTSGRGKESVEFRQESSVVKYNDKRPESERTNQLFFVVFEWRDVFIQEVRDIVTANAWSSVAILCGVFMALFKVANFAKLSVKWIMKIRKAHLRRRAKEMAQVT